MNYCVSTSYLVQFPGAGNELKEGAGGWSRGEGEKGNHEGQEGQEKPEKEKEKHSPHQRLQCFSHGPKLRRVGME